MTVVVTVRDWEDQEHKEHKDQDNGPQVVSCISEPMFSI